MASLTLKGNAIHTSGDLPQPGTVAPSWTLVGIDLSEMTPESFNGKKKVLNIFPSVDTGTCAASVRRFNQEAAKLPGVMVLNISADLPFALKRFCGAEGIENAQALSTFRSSFASDYGLKITDGPLAGLCSRAVIVLNEHNQVLHAEQVSEIVNEPDYDAAIRALGA